MQNDWIRKAKTLLAGLAWLASRTRTTADDEAVAFLQSAIEIQAVQDLINWLINASQSDPGMSTEHLLRAAPPELMTAAESQAVAKIGDGKLLAVLLKFLPLLLAL